MATSGTRGLQRQSLSSKRAQRTIETIEAQIGVSIGSDPSNYSSSEETSSEHNMGTDKSASVDKTDKW